jgi:transposase
VEKIICGVDVAKARLDACIKALATHRSFDNSAEGITQLAAFCKEHKVQLVAMEATGGYERLAFLMLWELDVPCALANARNIRRFAEAMGFLEKTDKIDASVIAHFAAVKDMKPDLPPSRAQQRLKALVLRLRQLTDDISANTLRFRTAPHLDAANSIAEVLTLLRRQAKSVEGEIMSMIDDDPLWQKLGQAFSEIKGVAKRTISRLMAELPEIGIYDNKAIAKLAGLSPIAKDSGTSSGRRHIRGGRGPIRSTLYVVGYIVAKYDPHMNAFASRLKEAGKPAMVIRIAVARKLLVRLNAKARDARKELNYAT